jgi:endonuclease/exonuclease/phosphatase family metal-dependent hydrolase
MQRRFLTLLLLTSYPLGLLAEPLAAAEAKEAKEVGKRNRTLRVMTYNIHHGQGIDGIFDLERLAKVITGRRADLVAIQEVDVKTKRSKGVDQAAELARLTGMHYAFGKFMDFQGGDYGQMVLSKFPITRARNLTLPKGPEPRTALAVDVEVEGVSGPEKIVFVGIHFYATEQERIAQAKRLTELLAPELKAGVPTILAGDFNSTPGSRPLAVLTKNWIDPTAAKLRRTWPSDRPRVEIDHILYFPTQRFQFVKSKVLVEKVASDHRPVLTMLKFVRKKGDRAHKEPDTREAQVPTP